MNALFHRKPETHWSDKEIRAYRKLGEVPEDDLKLIESYYTASFPENADYRRHDLQTLLNNFQGEIDRARKHTPANTPGRRQTINSATGQVEYY